MKQRGGASAGSFCAALAKTSANRIVDQRMKGLYEPWRWQLERLAAHGNLPSYHAIFRGLKSGHKILLAVNHCNSF